MDSPLRMARDKPVIVAVTLLYCTLVITGDGKPIEAPDLSKCNAQASPSTPVGKCCLPISPNIVNFTLPPPSKTLRVRPAGHLVDENYIRKYKNATMLMKALPSNHPWNFMQQANIHCAYCDDAYNQTSYPNVTLQVHSSWLFLPYHRAYLYFYERILGKLIGDETFALPFWNWDAPDGMGIPTMYTELNSSLYDDTRNPNLQPPNIVRYGFVNSSGGDVNRSAQIAANLRVMYAQMVAGGTTKELFLGSPYRAGDSRANADPGSLEMVPHGLVHAITGEHMAAFATAGRDPIFFAHHSNVDRMWEIWKGLPGGKRENYNDTDWLEATFAFWDENEQLVHIHVRDLLDTKQLGYTYQDRPVLWLNTTSPSEKLKKPSSFIALKFPLTLEEPTSIVVERPESEDGKAQVLVVHGIELDRRVHARFDVYISSGSEDSSAATIDAVLVGFFVHLPTGQSRRGAHIMRTRLVLGITKTLEELEADQDNIIVTLVPRTEGVTIKLAGVRIEHF